MRTGRAVRTNSRPQAASAQTSLTHQFSWLQRQVKRRQPVAPARLGGRATRERVVAARAACIGAFFDLRPCASRKADCSHVTRLSNERLLSESTVALGLSVIFGLSRHSDYFASNPGSLHFSAKSCHIAERQFKPKTSCMSNKPLDFPCKNFAARIAPTA